MLEIRLQLLVIVANRTPIHLVFPQGLAAIAVILQASSGSAVAQDLQGNQINQLISPLNIYCDPNGGGTGTCWSFDQNKPLDCEFASQDFIQCEVRSTKAKLICVYYAPLQFSCRQETDPGSSSLQKQTIRNTLMSPLRPYKNPTELLMQDQLKTDFVDTFGNE